jgi:hypothetical protein
LFEDELNLLKTHGDEIARSMGFPGKGRKEREHHIPHHEEKRWRQAKWGDTEVGKWNMGVNGEQGLGGGWERGYDVVELGAGYVHHPLLESMRFCRALTHQRPSKDCTST